MKVINKANKVSVFSPIRIVLMALFVAFQILFSRVLGLQLSESIRISIETVPIILSGLYLGPVSGMLVGLTSDILGTLLSGYGVYFPLLSVGPILVGLFSGLVGYFILKSSPNKKWLTVVIIFVAVLVIEAISSLLYGTWAVQMYLKICSSKDVPYRVLFLSRLASKGFTIPIDALLSALIYRLTVKTVQQNLLHQ